jgi:hypothetical protein
MVSESLILENTNVNILGVFRVMVAMVTRLLRRHV